MRKIGGKAQTERPLPPNEEEEEVVVQQVPRPAGTDVKPDRGRTQKEEKQAKRHA